MKIMRSLFIFVALTSQAQAATRMLCTAALIESGKEMRKQHYINCLQNLHSYGLYLYVVESVLSQGPTFLDEYADDVFYANTNNPHLRNKGVNEAIAVQAALRHYAFDDDDMIIKYTARYILHSDAFIKAIENHPEVDAIVCRDSIGQVRTVCFAMRNHHMQQMLRELNFNRMESAMINFEWEVAQYLARHNVTTLELATIGLSGHVGGSNEFYAA
jgi:hypothetical protein